MPGKTRARPLATICLVNKARIGPKTNLNRTYSRTERYQSHADHPHSPRRWRRDPIMAGLARRIAETVPPAYRGQVDLSGDAAAGGRSCDLRAADRHHRAEFSFLRTASGR